MKSITSNDQHTLEHACVKLQTKQTKQYSSHTIILMKGPVEKGRK